MRRHVEVRTEGEVFGVVLFQEDGAGRVDLRGRPVLRHGIARDGRILGSSRIEKHLLVEDAIDLLRRAEDTVADIQEVVESLLRDVELRHEVVHAFHVEHRRVLRISQRGPVARCRTSAAEGHMMVLHKPRARDGVGKVGVVAIVLISQPQPPRRGHILSGGEHLDILADGLHAPRAVVRDVESRTGAFFGGHLDDTRGSARTVLCRLRRIAQDGKALDIGRIDRRERGEVRIDSVDDDERIVAARERCRATHTHRRELRHAVLAVGDVDTRCLTVDGRERVGDKAFVHAVLTDDIHRAALCPQAFNIQTVGTEALCRLRMGRAGKQ